MKLLCFANYISFNRFLDNNLLIHLLLFRSTLVLIAFQTRTKRRDVYPPTALLVKLILCINSVTYIAQLGEVRNLPTLISKDPFIN